THPVYTALHHDTLIEFITSEEIAGGFAMIFKWADGDCMGHMYPAARKVFMALPNETKLRIFSDISRFFAYIAEQGWLAVDFYDGSILYDPKRGKTTICDIDFFRPSPSINDMGRMWGSSRFQAPEEYEHGAVLDEITNVYTLGATAFALFADSDRSLNAWPLSDALYDIAAKATNSDRVMRHSSIVKFINEWNAAL
ncbi:MAG: serine/threonine protein kinase, partial [Clostridia bacterium]|nr:serine/threonine protein kinase [Clostridia bacterium]